MSKETALEMTNAILSNVGGARVSTLTGIVGIAQIILDSINRAQKRIAAKPDVEWYTLFKSRLFKTIALNSSTITITPGSPDQITDSANGLGIFTAGAEITINSSGNDQYRFVINTVSAGTIVLDSSNIISALSSGTEVLISQVSYSVASDFRNSIDILDPANNRILKERFTKSLDIERRWANNVTGIPDMFTVAGDFYRLSWVPEKDIVLIDRYMKQPSKLISDSQTSDLPEFCDTALYYLAYSDTLFFKKNLEQGAAEYNKYKADILDAVDANSKIMDMENVVEMNINKLMHGNRISSGSILTIEEG